jgi:hypothetical protein
MRQAELIERLARVPAVKLATTPAVDAALAESVRYLGSDAALRSLAQDTYWPKWDSPWWHMLLLLELGEAQRIPERAARAMVDELNALRFKIFPIAPEENRAVTDPWRDTTCHCALGSIYQVLSACGVEVERELPWVAPWFLRYQMADGGLNCDDAAYLVKDECPSSMVGTVPPLEAMLLGPMTAERQAFVDRAAHCLIERQLMLGSPTRHNAKERERETVWLQACFPRFYFYDVLRGARALTRWAGQRGRTLPLSAVEPVVAHLLAAYPDGIVRLGRRAFEATNTCAPDGNGVWVRGLVASRFSLLEATSEVGAPSPSLTRQWAELRCSLLGLFEAKRILA